MKDESILSNCLLPLNQFRGQINKYPIGEGRIAESPIGTSSLLSPWIYLWGCFRLHPLHLDLQLDTLMSDLLEPDTGSVTTS
jgi:hypothetical protein